MEYTCIRCTLSDSGLSTEYVCSVLYGVLSYGVYRVLFIYMISGFGQSK